MASLCIPDSQQPTSPIGFLFLKLPPPPCAVLLVDFPNEGRWQVIDFKGCPNNTPRTGKTTPTSSIFGSCRRRGGGSRGAKRGSATGSAWGIAWRRAKSKDPRFGNLRGCNNMLKWWFKVKMLKKWNSTTSSQTTSCVSACRLVKSLRACQKNLGWVKKLLVLPKNLFSLESVQLQMRCYVMFCLFSRGNGGID